MKRMTTTQFIACWLLLCPAICIAQDRYHDSLALVALYNATNGINWTNTWALNLPMDNWYGIEIESDRIKKLRLPGNQLSGNIPSEIGNLTKLVGLTLTDNQLSGNIPTEIDSLINLKFLYLNNNQFSGDILSKIGGLISVEKIHLSNNQFTDSIPSDIGNLTNLRELRIGTNQFTENIIPEIWNLTNLEILNLSDNQLSGNIPSEIENLTKLKILNLGNNRLSGNIPSEIDSLINLESLYLNKNQFSGNIPSEIENLTKLKILNLGNNRLSGNISSQIDSLINLESLYLDNNQFSGDILSKIENLTNLKVLSLQNNQFSGNMSSKIGDLTSLEKIYLFNNQFTGSIPSEIGNLTNLIVLRMSVNQFTGSIPNSIGNLTNLEYLTLRQNKLSGSIPARIGNLPKLKWLRLSSNDLSGTIPNLDSLMQLEWLHLGYNDLSGNIPTSIGDLVNLKRLNLYNNKYLDGSITHLANLSNLNELKLSGNRFSGDIPDFSMSSDSMTLHLDNNKFPFDAVEASYDANNSISDFQYSPQYHGEVQSYIVETDDDLTFTLSENLPDNSSNVSYQWKKNDTELAGSTDSTFTITNLKISDVGKYTLHMTDSTRVADLEVISEPIYVILPGYDLLGQPVEYNQLIIEYDDLQDKENYETNHLFPNGAFEADHCSCNRLLYLYQFPNDTIALQTLLDIDTKKQSTTRRGRLDGGFNNILGIGPIPGTQGWTWTNNYPHNYPDSVSIFLLDSGTDVQNWDATSYLNDDAPLDSCYNILPHSGYDYTDTLTSIQGGFVDSIGHGTFGMRSIAEGSDMYMNMNVVPLKVFDQDGQGTLFNFICALYHAIDHDADIINVSAGYTGQASGILEDAIALAHAKGQFIVTATGNDGVCIDSFPQYPAYYAKPFYKTAYDGEDSLVHYTNVISVAAIDATDTLWRYSNYGGGAATIAAYGENMGGYAHTGEEVSYSGTSLSAYYVTRQLAAEIARNKTRSLQDIWAEFEANYLHDCPSTNGLTSTGKCLDISLREVYGDLHVFLEGAFDILGDTMHTKLNTLRHILPGQKDSTFDHTMATQPYDIAPFDYYGTERIPPTFEDYPTEVVDWILVSARTEIDASSTVSRTSAWLLKDGRVQLLKPLFDELTTAPDSVYIVIEHRNHMGVMSPQKLSVDRNLVAWDFTLQNSYTISGTGQVLLNNLYWGMLTGDTNNDIDGYDINGDDKGFWGDDNGQFGLYLPTDFNMDGDINGEDKIFWKNNNGKFSGISRY